MDALPSPWRELTFGAAALALLLLAWWLHVRFWVRRLSVPMAYESEHRFETADGSAIELRHLPPHGERAPGLPPVLLVHGLGANHRNHDMHPDASFARFLAEQGRDVWLLTLRSGRSDHRLGERRKIRFEAMVRHDVPLAVEHVCDQTGAEQVDYAGYSMGGMLLYAALGRTVPEQRIRRVVIFGSPGRVEPPVRVLRALRALPNRLIPGLPLRLASRTWAFAATRLPAPFHRLVSNPDNIEPPIARAALVDVIEDIPGCLQADFARWAFDDGELRVGGERVLDHLGTVDVPVLFFAGAADQLAPVDTVRHAYEAWGARHPEIGKELRILGRDRGTHADYGHGDMAAGRYVRTEVFEPAAEFLAARERAFSASAAGAAGS